VAAEDAFHLVRRDGNATGPEPVRHAPGIEPHPGALDKIQEHVEYNRSRHVGCRSRGALEWPPPHGPLRSGGVPHRR